MGKQKANLKNRVKYWQNILGLNDWRINVKEVYNSDSCGSVSYAEVTKTAVIYVTNKESCIEQGFIVPFDMDATIVHELLHLKFCLLWESNSSLRSKLLHQNIESLALSFSKLKQDCDKRCSLSTKNNKDD